MKNVTNNFKILTKKIKYQDLKCTLLEENSIVKLNKINYRFDGKFFNTTMFFKLLVCMQSLLEILLCIYIKFFPIFSRIYIYLTMPIFFTCLHYMFLHLYSTIVGCFLVLSLE